MYAVRIQESTDLSVDLYLLIRREVAVQAARYDVHGIRLARLLQCIVHLCGLVIVKDRVRVARDQKDRRPVFPDVVDGRDSPCNLGPVGHAAEPCDAVLAARLQVLVHQLLHISNTEPADHRSNLWQRNAGTLKIQAR